MISVFRLEDYSTSYTRHIHVIAIYRKALPPCCFLLMVGSVSNLELEFLSGRIHLFRCSRSVKYVGVFLYRTVCINLVSRVLIRKSIVKIFREDINDEIEHLSNFLLLKISRVVDFIIRSSCNSCSLVELVSKVDQ